jgi:peptidoglycan/LPS O-acetylase OafA/YrhL
VRGLFVLMVMVFHLVGAYPSGGFLSVDVFFVLSGYLITSLLLREHRRSGRISLPNFWSRRARRLLPAILLLVGTTAVVVASTAPVATLEARRGDLVSTLLYYANWHFIATDQSYFANFDGVSPLRHMWSLSIEEQFYLLWPLLAVLVLGWTARGGSRMKVVWALLAGAGLSALIMSSLYNPADPSSGYFNTAARAHQVLIGVALAVLVDARPGLLAGARARAVARWAWPLALALVVVPLATYADQEPFYYKGGSVLFALAVAAALWAIEAAPESPLARGLSLRPLVWIGTISYGLYLWHWPMFVWIGSPRTGADGWLADVGQVAAVFAAATISSYLLERPIQRGRMPWIGWSRRRLAVAIVVGFEVIAGVVVWSTIVDSTSAVGRGLSDHSDTPCPQGSPSVDGFSWCVKTRARGPGAPVVATAGDSTSRALDPGMMQMATARGWRYIQAGQGGCSLAPLLMPATTEPGEVGRKRLCIPAIRALLGSVTALDHPDVWIVSDRVPIGPKLVDGPRVLGPADPRRDRIVRTAVRSTLQRLEAGGAQVVMVATPPPAQPADCATKGTAICNAAIYTTGDPGTRHLDGLYRQVIATLGPRVHYIDVDDVFCPRGGRCPAVLDGVLGRFDQIHYTARFSRRLVPVIISRAEREGVVFRRGAGRRL